MKSIPRRALAGILDQPWAIRPEWLKTITEIVQREGEDPEALAARLGRPLQRTQSVEMRGPVAVLPVVGPIFPRANLMTEFSGATSLEIMARDLTTSLESDEVESVLLQVDSPGGVAFGISEMAGLIRAANKPVVAHVGGLGASAAFWIAAAADQVVASDTALLGSIGVVMAISVQEQPDRDGFREFEIVSSNAENKRPDPRSDAGMEELRRTLDDLEQKFVAAVAEFRSVSVETALSDFGRGGLLIAAQAVEAGMADRVASFEEIAGEMEAGRLPRPAGRGQSTARSRTMDKLTAADLAAKYPEAVEEIRTAARAEGHKAGKGEGLEEGREIGAKTGKAEGLIKGAQAERGRIADLKANVLPGFEAQLEACIADGTSTAADLAQAIVAAQREKGAAHLQAVKDDKTALDKTGGLPDPSAGDGQGAGTKTKDKGGDAKALARAAQKLMADEAAAGRTIAPDEAIERIRQGEAA